MAAARDAAGRFVSTLSSTYDMPKYTARDKICPFTFAGAAKNSHLCCADTCMAWRGDSEEGHCGLVPV